MAGKESNPIQQRMEKLVEKWEALLIANPKINLVRILAQENEKEMVSTFYSYLLGVDTDNHDIPIIFNSIFHDANQYSKALLAELQEMIDMWNNCDKSNVNVEIQNLDWKIDYTLTKSDNAAYVFIENINRLAAFLKIPDGTFLVPILRVSFMDSSAINNWLNLALKTEINQKVKLVVDDTVDVPVYNPLVSRNSDKAVTLIPDLDMDTAMQQVAAMGNPNDPAVQYRKAFLLMMQAIEKRKQGDVEKHADVCIAIANKNISKNPYWLGQLIAVNAALANDQVGHKNFKKAIQYSTRGVKAAEDGKEIIPDEFVHRKLLGQALMLRASLYAADKNWAAAVTDFTIAADHYIFTNDMILAMESLRMLGFCHQKEGNKDEACIALSDAVDLSKQIPKQIIKFTTFAGVIEALLEINNSKYISHQEIAEAAQSAYGDEWQKEIKNWKSPHYEAQTDPSLAMK